MENFIDDDEEEILTDNDLIEMDENDLIYDSQASSNEELNHMDTNSEISEADDQFEMAPHHIKLLQSFCLTDHSKILLSNIGMGDLETFLHNHWKIYVPICFNAFDTPKKNMLETDSEKVLLKPLEIYLANSLESDKYFNELKELEEPPTVCGRVFKNGEPSYFCRECGTDPTCVLCSFCFRNSKHRYHKYVMMTSGGGGYCDCGDPEAWKSDPCCDLHMPKSTSQPVDDDTPQNYYKNLPNDLVERAKHLFTYILQFVFDVISSNKEELPESLRQRDGEDDYVTMLYNDEVHSYEQVVNTLKRVIGADDRKAFDYAAIVDKEGRSAIKRAKKSTCEEIKLNIEKTMSGPNSKPLDTKVFHHSLVAHQYFAEKILVWLQKICNFSKGLKNILCEVGTFNDSNNQNLIEKLMINDSVYWKSARTILHQFYISMFFMDSYWKKKFSILFIKNYKVIWNSHVKNPDDTTSLTELTVQIFTVPSLSKYLIEQYSIIQTIMDTIIEHSSINQQGKLSFPRSRQRSGSEFKRAQSMLFDLKYCLTSVPKVWNDSLRKNYLNGFKSFINFLKKMHGMDALKRQSQQHLEYEPEWETSFNLVIKLQKSISSLIEWCSSDQSVYEKSMEYLLSVLYQIETNESLFAYKYSSVKFNDNTYEYIEYQVIRESVSIHAPLSRMLAAIFSQMKRFDLNFNQLWEKSQSKVSMPRPKALAMIEPSLRALILVGQTNAGFWKRNGFSLLSQVYFYSNIKCRHEMFDRDIQCLQMGASLMNPNEFLINLLHHYGIYEFLTNENYELTKSDKPTDDQKIDFLTSMSQEFLEILIYIFSERYSPLMSQIESSKRLEREVIHQLCISPMAHSDLVKNIFPDNEKFTNELENVLSRIANFKSSINSKGVYELKEEYQAYYSPYFYHYTRSDKSKSEEYQLSKKKTEAEKFFKPPRLPPFNELYSNINHLLDCDVFIKIVFCLIRRQINQPKMCTSGQIMRILHLIGLALYEEQDDVDKNIQSLENNETYLFKFLEKSLLNKKKSSLFSIKSFKTEDNLVKLLDDLINTDKNESFKQMAIWINDYLLKLLKLKHKIDQQKIQLDKEGASGLDAEKELKDKKKNEIAEKRRAKILAQLNLQSKKFIESHQNFYDETKISSLVSEKKKNDDILMECEKNLPEIVCIGPERKKNGSELTKTRRCILCQEEEEINLKNSPMVLCSYVQMSKVLSKNRVEKIEDFEKFDPLFMKNTLAWGITSTSCGHIMHASCWQKYVDTVRQIESRRNARFLSFDFKRNEYICPLCETIGNTVLPIYPELNSFSETTLQVETKSIQITFEDWIDGLEKTLENSVKKELHEDKDVFIINPCPLSTITKLMRDAVASNFRLLFENEYAQSLLPSVAQKSEPKLNSDTMNIVENFTRAAYTFGYSTLPHDDDSRMPISMWTNCAYTIQVTEQILRFESKPLFGGLTIKQNDLISNLVKQAAVYGILKNTESVRKSCLRLLATCMPYKTAFFELKNLMELDMFHMLVYLCLSMPNLYNDSPDLNSIVYGGINDLNILKLILIAHSVQILLAKISYQSFPTNSTQNFPHKDSKCNKVYEFYKFVYTFCADKGIVKTNKDGHENLPRNPSDIYSTLKLSLMPFLRCSALFFSNLTDTSPLAAISDNENKNFDTIMYFLGIKEDLSEILDIKSSPIKILVESWLTNEVNVLPRKGLKIDYPMNLNKFIELPHDFVDLMSLSTSNNVCTSRQSSIMDRTAESANIICLVCGELLCSQVYCCQKDLFKKRVGNCTAHAYFCGGKTGVFLRVSECQVLLLNINYTDSSDLDVKGCFLPAPYLDDYGETDQGLRRGNPLKLCKARYDKLYKDWLSHSIPEVISRQFQMQNSMVTANWSEF